MAERGTSRTPLLAGIITFLILFASLYWVIPYVLGGREAETAIRFSGLGVETTLSMVLLTIGILLAFTIAVAVFFLSYAYARADVLADSKTSELIKSRDFFLKLFDDSPVPYLMLDKDANIILPNKASQRLFGRTAEELMPYKFQQLIDEQYITESRSLYERFIRGVAASDVELEIARKDGKKRWVRLSAIPYRSMGGGEKGGVVTLVDITEQKAIDKVKTEFVSLASHQLRTPLSAMKWYSELVLSGNDGELNEKQRKHIQKIYEGNERMIELVSALLSASRLELGSFKIDIMNVDPVGITKELLDELRPDIEKKRMRIVEQYDGDHTNYYSDKKLLHMVIQNLLTNAVKYTNEDGTVRISISCSNEMMRLVVADNGLGIPDDEQSKIFTKMFRAGNARLKVTDGTGLGLYIVKEAVEALHGTVAFVSRENEGTEFTVVLPNGTHGKIPAEAAVLEHETSINSA